MSDTYAAMASIGGPAWAVEVASECEEESIVAEIIGNYWPQTGEVKLSSEEEEAKARHYYEQAVMEREVCIADILLCASHVGQLHFACSELKALIDKKCSELDYSYKYL